MISPARACLVFFLAGGVAIRDLRADDPVDTAVSELPPLSVSAAPVEDEEAVRLDTIADELRAVPGVEIRSQGLASGQTDLQIRGSSFSGAGLAVGGLALRNPQTEHFNAELPVSSQLFAQPAVLTGLAQAAVTDGHLVGTVGYDFLPIERHGVFAAGLGENSRDWQSFLVQTPLVRTPQRIEPGLSVFGSRENAGSTDGYPDNFLDRWNGGAHLQLRTADSQTDLIAATGWKRFGARGFYGAPANLPSQEELQDRLVLGSSRWGQPDENFMRLTGAWRQLVDRYQLDRTRPGLYENLHRSTELAANLDGAERLLNALRLRWRLEAAEETLHSRYEGTLPSTGLGDHRRARAGLALLPEWSVGDLRLTLGGRVQAFSDDRPAWLPVAGVVWELAPGQTLYADYTETVRQPSFTELNYDSPGSLGNQGLERQHDRAFELGWRGRHGDHWTWRLAAFRGESENAVDWIKTSAASRWLAVNLERVTTTGLECASEYRPCSDLELDFSYAALHKRGGEGVYASRYVLDYPEQCVSFGGRWRPTAFCELRLLQGIRFQAANPVREGGRVAYPASAEVRFTLARQRDVTLALSCENLWGDNFETFPGQPVAGRRVAASLQMTW